MAQVAREVQWALVWVAAEYVFGVMMGVLSEQHRLSPASHWSTPPILPSDWLQLSEAPPLMITTLMTFLRSLNNEGQEERYRAARQAETDHWRAFGGKWFPAFRIFKEDNVQPVCWVFVFS